MNFCFCRMAYGHHCRGFTLLELAVTMAVLGILTVSAVSLYAVVVKRQRETKTKEEMKSIKEAILGYYQNGLVLPSSDSGYKIPIGELNLPSSAQTDEIYTGKYYAYVATNNGSPFSELKVDGQSIGNTSMVLISSGTNLTFEEENTDLEDGEYTQKSSSMDFDDILIYFSANELEASISWRREIEEEVAVLNKAAQILAENDDDGDGYVDEDDTDPNGNWDSITSWYLVSGMQSLVFAGLIADPDHVVDPWGTGYIWDSTNHEFYSAGPNRTDEGCGGDDICS